MQFQGRLGRLLGRDHLSRIFQERLDLLLEGSAVALGPMLETGKRILRKTTYEY